MIRASTEIDLKDAAWRERPKETRNKEPDREPVARLVGEITDHLGYDKHQRGAGETGNSRNGARSRTVVADVGPVEISVPRDRDGSVGPAMPPIFQGLPMTEPRHRQTPDEPPS
ncbi:hypothetical protein GCM10020220_093700 [Nonomuraea rubra]